MSFQNYLFLGFGLIGGSIAKALRNVQPDAHITAWARRRERLMSALTDGTLDTIAESLTSDIQNADVIFLCAPTGSNIENLRTIAPLLPRNCLLTDVGSVKGDIQAVADDLGISQNFLGGHPMTGREKSGYTAADARILENAYYILTPSKDTLPTHCENFTALVRELRAIPLLSDPVYHDYATAAISHLPHLIAVALVKLVADSDNDAQFMKTIAAGGFRDITRIAASDPAMWESICQSNTKNIRKLLSDYIEDLKAIDDILANGEFHAIGSLFQNSGAYRNSLAQRSTSAIPDEPRLYVDIPDETGQIAAVAGLLASEGINIKNIGITHNREQAEGALLILFEKKEDRDAAIPVLKSHQYTLRAD